MAPEERIQKSEQIIRAEKIAEAKKEVMEKFVHDRGLTTFYEMVKLKADTKQEHEPYIKNHKEQWALKGFAQKKYERSRIAELTYYDIYREKIKGMILEPDKKITPEAWQKELYTLLPQFEETKKHNCNG